MQLIKVCRTTACSSANRGIERQHVAHWFEPGAFMNQAKLAQKELIKPMLNARHDAKQWSPLG